MTRKQVFLAIKAGLLPRIGYFIPGGGAPGVDMAMGEMRALERFGVVPCALSGTSAGSQASVCYAKVRNAAACCEIVKAMPPNAVQSPRMPSWIPDWITKGANLALNKPFYSNDKALALLRANAPTIWNDISLDLRMHSSMYDDDGCMEHLLTSADFATPAEAAMASMSIPWLFPDMVDLDGYHHIDGGVVCNVPIIDEWITNLDHCFLLIPQTREADRPIRNTSNELDRLLHIFRGMLHAQVVRAVNNVACADSVTVIWPDFVDNTSILTLNPVLIDQADAFTTQFLQKDMT